MKDDLPISRRQFVWFNMRLRKSKERLVFKPGDKLWHGYRSGVPNLDDETALWITSDRKIADQYSEFGGKKGDFGVIELTPKEAISFPRIYAPACEFCDRFGRKKSATPHSFYADRLHAWGVCRELHGVSDSEKDIVIFRAASLLEVISIEIGKADDPVAVEEIEQDLVSVVAEPEPEPEFKQGILRRLKKSVAFLFR